MKRKLLVKIMISGMVAVVPYTVPGFVSPASAELPPLLCNGGGNCCAHHLNDPVCSGDCTPYCTPATSPQPGTSNP